MFHYSGYSNMPIIALLIMVIGIGRMIYYADHHNDPLVIANSLVSAALALIGLALFLVSVYPALKLY